MHTSSNNPNQPGLPDQIFFITSQHYQYNVIGSRALVIFGWNVQFRFILQTATILLIKGCWSRETGQDIEQPKGSLAPSLFHPGFVAPRHLSHQLVCTVQSSMRLIVSHCFESEWPQWLENCHIYYFKYAVACFPVFIFLWRGGN